MFACARTRVWYHIDHIKFYMTLFRDRLLLRLLRVYLFFYRKRS